MDEETLNNMLMALIIQNLGAYEQLDNADNTDEDDRPDDIDSPNNTDSPNDSDNDDDDDTDDNGDVIQNHPVVDMLLAFGQQHMQGYSEEDARAIQEALQEYTEEDRRAIQEAMDEGINRNDYIDSDDDDLGEILHRSLATHVPVSHPLEYSPDKVPGVEWKQIAKTTAKLDCPICLDVFDDEHICVVCRECQHAVHQECFVDLAKHDDKCPYCLNQYQF